MTAARKRPPPPPRSPGRPAHPTAALAPDDDGLLRPKIPMTRAMARRVDIYVATHQIKGGRSALLAALVAEGLAAREEIDRAASRGC